MSQTIQRRIQGLLTDLLRDHEELEMHATMFQRKKIWRVNVYLSGECGIDLDLLTSQGQKVRTRCFCKKQASVRVSGYFFSAPLVWTFHLSLPRSLEPGVN